MSIEEFILEVSKVMIPVLTGFLVIFAKAISPLLESLKGPSKPDLKWIILISICGLLSFGGWAGALAGAMISTAGGGETIFGLSFKEEEAIILARKSVAFAYGLFVIVVMLSGAYYLLLLRRKYSDK